MVMSPRTQQILEAVIREFIETGEPVSSRQICVHSDFGVKEATIRNELNALMSDGFLEQPHTSAGRVPSDKGYRFFVEMIMENVFENVSGESDQNIPEFKNSFSAEQFHDFIDDVSEKLNVLGVGYIAGNDVYKSGLDELFHNFVLRSVFFDPREAFQIVKDFELIDEKIGDLRNFLGRDSEPKVFIGRSPITKSRQLSVIANEYDLNDEKFVLAAVGPKQMDYPKVIKFFKELKI